jgi:hypothetical protein
MFIFSIHNKVETKIHPTDGLLCNYYFHRPVRKVEVSGIAISVERTTKRYSILVDDGTGIINCIKYLSTNPRQGRNYSSIIDIPPGTSSGQEVKVGDFILVKGNLEKLETNALNYQFMIKISILEKQQNSNVEILNILSTIKLNQTMYNKPFHPLRTRPVGSAGGASVSFVAAPKITKESEPRISHPHPGQTDEH